MRDTVIFDLDGTLLDTLDDLTTAVNYCMQRFGGPIHTREEVRSKVGNGIYILMEKALPGGREHPFYTECMQAFPSYYKEHMTDKTVPYPGILSLLKCLNNDKYKLAIVSNKFDAAVKGLNERFFGEFISVAIGEMEDRGIRKKPAPDTVFQAMRELHSRPEQCIYVGDSDTDLQTAANVGIPCICVTWGFRDAEFLREKGAEFIADTPGQLYDEIRTFSSGLR